MVGIGSDLGWCTGEEIPHLQGSGKSSMKQDLNVPLKWIASISLIGFLSAAFYLWSSHQMHGLGFPLDDAWIHQTYARNLILEGEWSYLPGVPSAGSTSPLWTFMIALGPPLRMDHRFWTYLVGIGLLVILGWISSKWFCLRMEGKSGWGWLAGMVIGLEWHLIWASVSGMETLAFATLCVAIFLFLDRSELKPFSLGALIGLGTWIRPGAITLLIPSVFVMLTARPTKPMKEFFRLVLGLSFLLIPYMLFNHLLTGSVWPNTFYAKQAEYAILSQSSLLTRFVRQLIQPLIGVGALLVPGIIYSVMYVVRKRQWSRLAALLWVLIYLGMYAVRLPVTYQHGRYAIPTIPVILIIGWEGVSRWVKLDSHLAKERILSRLWVGSALAVLVSFVFIGARAYSQDVAIIETEMVASSKWVAENTEEDALIAAHDIGALGYFGHRDLLDLAGLISPEVIPFIRDEEALASYLDNQGADYLMTFPNWYPNLVVGRKILYKTNAEFSPDAGGDNMVVYQWGY
jgi:hypothetical protein